MGAYKAANLVVYYWESRECRDRAHHVRSIIHKVCQIHVDVWPKPIASWGEFLLWDYPVLEWYGIGK